MTDEEDQDIVEFDNSSNPKKILKLFPYIMNKFLASRLKIDTDALHYITVRDYSVKINNIIIELLDKIKLKPENCIITDTTACVGGNAISFAQIFKYVYAIEINKKRTEFLKNNIDVYNLTNINVIHNNFLKEIDKIKDHNIVFIDPPWGGKNYKDIENLKLSISNIPLENIIKDLIDLTKMAKIPELIVLKLPTNYDIKHFYDNFNNKDIYYYNLEKMLILGIIV